MLHAVRAVITTPLSTVAETLQHVIGVATDALSCEIGVVRDGAGRRALSGSWSPSADDLDDALDELVARADGQTYCVQDSASVALPAPLRAEDGIHSVLAVPLPEPLGGILVTAHTAASPRGFTSLCQHLGEQVADTAGVVAHTAVLREDLRDLADEHFRTARTDALTGLGNRMRWEEALGEAQDRVDERRPDRGHHHRRRRPQGGQRHASGTTRATRCYVAAPTSCATTPAPTTCCAASAGTSSRC